MLAGYAAMSKPMPVTTGHSRIARSVQLPGLEPVRAARLCRQFHDFVARADFPCVGAKAAKARGGLTLMTARSITSAWDDLTIATRLLNFAKAWRRKPLLFRTFVVLFDGPRRLTELEYEQALWARLQSLSDKDRWLGQAHDPQLSADPENPHFGLSFGGEGFFAVGLHPGASRRSRRFAAPAIAFNLHGQFRQLRRDGRYEPMRARILERDEATSGSRNPMLARHGETSEARQYSGRQTEENWTCPFHPN